jgi:hypothetical protein
VIVGVREEHLPLGGTAPVAAARRFQRGDVRHAGRRLVEKRDSDRGRRKLEKIGERCGVHRVHYSAGWQHRRWGQILILCIDVFRLEANDPRAFLVAVVSLSLAALVASVIPARRAAGVDPMEATRAE